MHHPRRSADDPDGGRCGRPPRDRHRRGARGGAQPRRHRGRGRNAPQENRRHGIFGGAVRRRTRRRSRRQRGRAQRPAPRSACADGSAAHRCACTPHVRLCPAENGQKQRGQAASDRLHPQGRAAKRGAHRSLPRAGVCARRAAAPARPFAVSRQNGIFRGAAAHLPHTGRAYFARAARGRRQKRRHGRVDRQPRPSAARARTRCSAPRRLGAERL